jgi:HSP20 family protein
MDAGRTLTHWRDPFAQQVGELRDRFDDLFGDLFSGIMEGHDGAWRPAVDVVEEKGKLVIRADTPGVSPEDIEVAVEDGMLVISGHHDQERHVTGNGWVRQERRHGSFERTLPLPSGVDPQKVKAKVLDGVLEVTVPLPSEAKAERVTITPTAA